MTVARPPMERLMEKVVIDENGCWRFTGCHGGQGYGYLFFSVELGARVTHRIVYEHYVGAIPDDLTLDHLCRVRDCCNPAHLEPVTRGENVLRGIGFCPVNKAKTHCHRGHAFTPDNIYRVSKHPTWRHCRQCALDRAREYALTRVR